MGLGGVKAGLGFIYGRFMIGLMLLMVKILYDLSYDTTMIPRGFWYTTSCKISILNSRSPLFRRILRPSSPHWDLIRRVAA